MTAIYDPSTFDPSTSIGRLMTMVKGALMESLDLELAPLDITAAQFVVLVKLAGGETASPSTLCKGASYDPGAMTRMIDRLERKKLVRRVRSPEDRRRISIELTAEGRAVYPELIAGVVRVLNRSLRGFSKAEVRQLEDFLHRMLANA
ncbi:MAG TPA: MarR family transcriptional regulator [Casimicrobiaceae bacterium]|nr:MarR family transcriptional regulator [Casimicrobiaceae bacterium]